jgi:hypothetical protein
MKVCPRCSFESEGFPITRQERAALMLATAGPVAGMGLALSMIGIGLPLLCVSPLIVGAALFLPWRRCGNCGRYRLG